MAQVLGAASLAGIEKDAGFAYVGLDSLHEGEPLDQWLELGNTASGRLRVSVEVVPGLAGADACPTEPSSWRERITGSAEASYHDGEGDGSEEGEGRDCGWEDGATKSTRGGGGERGRGEESMISENINLWLRPQTARRCNNGQQCN